MFGPLVTWYPYNSLIMREIWQPLGLKYHSSRLFCPRDPELSPQIIAQISHSSPKTLFEDGNPTPTWGGRIIFDIYHFISLTLARQRTRGRLWWGRLLPVRIGYSRGGLVAGRIACTAGSSSCADSGEKVRALNAREKCKNGLLTRCNVFQTWSWFRSWHDVPVHVNYLSVSRWRWLWISGKLLRESQSFGEGVVPFRYEQCVDSNINR